MRITIAQLNPTVGFISGNLEKLKQALVIANKNNSDLVVFSELFLTGYPPRDLLERPWFIKKIQKTIKEILKISKEFKQLGIIFGAPQVNEKNIGKGLFNSAYLIYKGNILFTQNKSLLPTYDVFDETRYFSKEYDPKIIKFKDEYLGISICEDAWSDPKLWPKKYYPFDPQESLSKKGATVLINISASPFHIGKEEIRFRIFQKHAKKHNIPFVFVNQIGGNDELIFDGRSMYIDQNGNPNVILPAFAEKIHTIDIKSPGIKNLYKPIDKIESIYRALVLGIRDYLNKCGFSKVIIGLSGGIDSSVVCCLAKEAIGNKNILTVTMPSTFSSRGSIEDSEKLAQNLDIKLIKIPIASIYESYIQTLKSQFNTQEIDVSFENIQARIRGNILMALSNKFGYLVLSTGNKSELAVGYCTLYGDMTGGLSVLSDVPKTMVYDLADYINRTEKIIPQEILEKPPSAELRPNQYDSDSLPPYDILDPILNYYIDQEYPSEDIINLGFNEEIVRWVVNAVDRNEFKRRQAAPGLKVTPKAFGMGRRLPIAAKLSG